MTSTLTGPGPINFPFEKTRKPGSVSSVLLSVEVSMSDEFEEQIANEQQDIANCYRICRNFQDYGANTVWQKLRDHFSGKSDNDIAVLIIEVEKIVSQSSKPDFATPVQHFIRGVDGY